MNDFQKIGGIAALIDAATFIVGFVLLFTLMAPLMDGDLDTGQILAFLTDNQSTVYLFNLIIYVVFGVSLAVLAVALYERLKAGAHALALTSAAFGIIWATLVIASGMVANIGTKVVIDLYAQPLTEAGTVWLAIDTVRNGIGGGNEIVGGLWVLLVSWAGLRSGALPKALNYLGVVVSLAGILTVIPALGEIGGMIFGLGTIVWFIWLGIAMLRGSKSAA